MEGVSEIQVLGKERSGFHPFSFPPHPRAAAHREQRGAAGLCLLPGCGELPAQGKAENSLVPLDPTEWATSPSPFSLPE